MTNVADNGYVADSGLNGSFSADCSYDSNGKVIYHSSSASDSTASSGDNAELSEHEKLKIDICYRGLKTQVFVCSSLANLYYSDALSEEGWELRYTGIPVVLLDMGETRSRSKRKIQIMLAEQGTCFALWRDTIDNLSDYQMVGECFHTMFLSSDHRKKIGFSFDCAQAAHQMGLHIERLTSCPENISLSVPTAKNKKRKKSTPPVRLPTKSNISQPCCFQHVNNVDLSDRARYFSLKTLLPVLPGLSNTSEHSSSSDL